MTVRFKQVLRKWSDAGDWFQGNLRMASTPPPADRGAARVEPSGKFLTADFSFERTGVADTKTAACDKASPVRVVMLHLRACYVSKAAILTIPALHGPVENRSPA
jgi:hypothetical protein